MSDPAPAANREAQEVETLAERIAAGRVKHGVGASEDFPGNVCHLVSPIVGILRLRERDGEGFRADDMDHFIDRLSLVLDMARDEAARDAERERMGAERALREAADEWQFHLRRDAALFDYGRWLNAAARMLRDRADRLAGGGR